MHEKQRITHSMIVEGEFGVICSEVPPAEMPLVYEDANAMTKPIIKRHGNVMNPEIKSFFPGLMPQSLAGFAFIRRCQIRAREGIQYRKIFISSEKPEKSAVSRAANRSEPAEPEKKITIYRARNSIYIPIFYSLRFSQNYFYIIIYNGRGKY